MSLSEKLEHFRKHHAWIRAYLLQLVDDIEEENWYWAPESMTTHVAWQVGHIAMAQYGLTLFRQRGRQFIDSQLMSGKFRKKFMKGTQPSANRDDYPSRDEILTVLGAVNDQMLKELPDFDNEDHLAELIDDPNAGFGNKYGALMFACDHEMLHIGQIGMLRRLMGKQPLR